MNDSLTYNASESVID